MPESDAAETATETTEATTTTSTETVTTDADLKAEVEKWKALSKKNEERAKANTTAAKELETLRQSAMSEQEKAVALAREEGKSEARREAGIGRVEDAIRAAAGGRNVDVDALLDGIDRTKFLDDEGEPDRDAIQAWIDRIAPAEQEQGFRAPNLEQGTRTTTANAALNGDPLLRDLKSKLGIR